MGFTLRKVVNLLDPGESPLAPKFMKDAYKQTIGGKLQRMTNEYLDPYYDPKVRAQYYGKGGKVKKFSKGGPMDDLTPRSNLPDKNAKQQAEEAKKKDAKREKYNDLAPRESLPPKKYAKGGSVRGDGCCMKGKTKGRFR